MSYTSRALGDLFDVRAGNPAPQSSDAFCDEGTPFVRAGSLAGLLAGEPLSSLEQISQDSARRYRLTLFPKETILFAKSGMSALKGHIYQLPSQAYVVSHLAALTPKPNVDARYVRWVLETYSPTGLVKDPAYPSVRLPDIEQMEIPLPPLDEQRRIAAILDKADALRRKRREALATLTSLKWSLFRHRFGDPGENPHGWPTMPISELAASTQYGSSAKAGAEGEFPILRMGNITVEGDWALSDLKYIDLSAKEVDKYTVRSGDILFNRTNSPDLVGKTAVFREPEPFAYAGYLVRLRTNNLAHPEYVSAYLNSTHGKATLRGMCKSIIGMANINARELGTIRLPVPPYALQRAFADELNAIRASEEEQDRHLSHLDALFASLQHRAFRGEL